VLLLAVVSILVCVAYAGGAQGPPVLDDWAQLSDVLQHRGRGHELWGVITSPSGPLGRPVAMLTFWANATFTGTSFVHLKATNIALHILTGCLVFLFVRAILRRTYTSNSHALWGALAVASIWLAHPLLVSTVLYTVQRMTVLATAFSLCSLICWMKAREPSMRSKGFWITLSLCFWFVALFSKEVALLLPIQILLVEILVLSSNPHRWTVGVKALPKAVLLVLGLLLAIGLSMTFDYLAPGYSVRPFNPVERLLTEFRVLTSYLLMILFPWHGSMGFVHDDIVVSTSLLSPWTTLPSIILVCGLLSTALLIRERLPLVAFGLLFFFAGHLLESTVFPLELMFEHRNYLPTVGIIIAVVELLRRAIRHLKTLALIIVTMVSTLTFLTYARADIWSNETVLLNHFFNVHPNSPRLAVIFARELAKQDRESEALDLLSRHDSMGHYLERLQIQCMRAGEIEDDDFIQLERWGSLPVDTIASAALINLAISGLDSECRFSHQTFLDMLKQALGNPVVGAYNHDKLMMYKAHYEWSLGQSDSAVETLSSIYRRDDSNPMPLFLATEWLSELGEVSRAREFFERALQASRSSPRNYRSFEESVGAILSEAESVQVSGDHK
jgi:hypothetical protein